MLELEPGVAARQLQLPGAGAVLDAVPERDAVSRQPQVVRVVVGGGQDARRERLAAQLGQDEALGGRELELALERLRPCATA